MKAGQTFQATKKNDALREICIEDQRPFLVPPCDDYCHPDWQRPHPPFWTTTWRYASAHVLEGATGCLWVPCRISSIRSIDCAAANNPASFHPQFFCGSFLTHSFYYFFLLEHDLEALGSFWKFGFASLEKKWRATTGNGGCGSLAWSFFFFGIHFGTMMYLCCEDACSRAKTVHFTLKHEQQNKQ